MSSATDRLAVVSISEARFLLDTNVVSELVRPSPDLRVTQWLARQMPVDLFIAAMTLAELVRGVCRLPASHRRRRLEAWLNDELTRQFEGRILAFDHAAARIWGRIMGDADRRGRPRAAADAQIAAVALRHRLTVATRDTAGFEHLQVPLFSPWD